MSSFQSLAVFLAAFLTLFFSLFNLHSAQARTGVPKSCLEDVYASAKLYNSTSARLQAGEISESFGQMYLSATQQSTVNRAKVCTQHEKIMEERSPLGVYTQIQHFQLSKVLGSEQAEELLSFLGLPTQTNLQKKTQAMETAILTYFDELIFESHSQLAWEQ